MLKHRSETKFISPAFLAVVAGIAFTLYLFNQLLYKTEDWLLGNLPTLDVARIVVETLTVHWPSLLIWIGCLMVSMTFVQRALLRQRESAAQYRRIIETALEGIWIIDGNNQTTYVNQAMAQMLAYRVEEMIGAPLFAFMDEPAQALALGYVERRRQGIEEQHDFKFRRKDGADLWTILSTKPLFDPDGQYIGALALVTDITKRKQAEQSLHQSEELLRRIVDTIAEGIYMVDRDGRMTFANATAEKILGQTREQIALRSYNDPAWRITTLNGKPFPDDQQPFATVMRTGQPVFGVEQSIERMDGARVLVSINAAPLLDATGATVGEVALLSDITQRKQAEGALIQSREEAEALASIARDLAGSLRQAEILQRIMAHARRLTSSDLSYIAIREGTEQEYRIVAVSGAIGAGLPGLKVGAGRGLGGVALATGAAARTDDYLNDPRLGHQYHGVIRDEGITSQMVVPVWLGSEVAALLYLSHRSQRPYTEAELGLLSRLADHAAAALQNAQLFKNLEEQYHAAEQAHAQNRAVLDASSEAMVLVSPKGRFLNVNKRFYELFGVSADQVLGRRFDQVQSQVERIFADPAHFVARVANTALDTTQQFTEIVAQRWPAARELELYSAPVRSNADTHLGRLYVFRDVTQERAVDRMKTEFVSMVSHELRTPLTSIRGSLGLIAGGVAGELAPQVKPLIDIAYKNSERLVRLVNEILDVEKIESGKMVFNFKPLELMPLVEHAIEANRAYADQFGVTLALGPALPRVMVNGDPDRLTQVVTNLLSNAVKFSRPHGRVTLTAARHADTVRLAVSDQGPGIPEEFRNRIFQKFAQADSSDTRQKGGTGLGLSISKAIVEKHGGQIGFETTLNVGATFYFDLPEWHMAISTSEPSLREVTPLTQPKRILICEDDQDIATLLSLILKQDGFDNDIAYDAAQAKQLLAQKHYDGMTLDMMLPGQDGISLFRELRAQPHTCALPIIVVSAKAERSRNELNGDAIGIADWLEKPIDVERLTAALQRAVQHSVRARPRMLHVEDDPDVVKVVAGILQNFGDVISAESLQEATQRLSAESYDLVILDLKLSDGSGLELVPLLNRHIPPTPVVIFSSEEIGPATAQNIAAALVKSRTSNQELLATIKSLITATGSNHERQILIPHLDGGG